MAKIIKVDSKELLKEYSELKKILTEYKDNTSWKDKEITDLLDRMHGSEFGINANHSFQKTIVEPKNDVITQGEKLIELVEQFSTDFNKMDDEIKKEIEREEQVRMQGSVGYA